MTSASIDGDVTSVGINGDVTSTSPGSSMITSTTVRMSPMGVDRCLNDALKHFALILWSLSLEDCLLVQQNCKHKPYYEFQPTKTSN